jgi:hypothetical protein
MWNTIEIIVNALLLGPAHLLGIAVGLTSALVAYTFLPETVDRSSIAALTFFAGWILTLAILSLVKRSK